MKTYYVYELINTMGTVEYVGETKQPKRRMYDHTQIKPIYKSGAFGTFYGRQDLIMNIVTSFADRKEARELEGKLKLMHGLEWTEKSSSIKGGKIGGKNTALLGYLSCKGSIAKKPVLQYSKNGDYVELWESASKAAKDLEIQQSEITKNCRGKRKSAGGFIWKYEKN